MADLHERMAEPWFDPAGFLLVVDDADRRRSSASTGPRSPDGHPDRRTVGEVYVVGRRPGAPGPRPRPAAHPAGLAHLARPGLREVLLYVDGDNTAARRTYERLGFTDAAVDGQYTLATT